MALVAGLMWGARDTVSFTLRAVSLKVLPVLILGGFTSVPGVIVAGLLIACTEKLGEFYCGLLVGAGLRAGWRMWWCCCFAGAAAGVVWGAIDWAGLKIQSAILRKQVPREDIFY